MFFSRQDAGKKLALRFKEKNLPSDLVMGIARGGVIVAKEIADFLKIPLGVLVVKKIGAPGNPELAIGAITSDGTTYIDEQLANSVAADKKYIKTEKKHKRREAREREQLLSINYTKTNFRNKTIIITDDGVATGATFFTAITYLKKLGAGKIIVALPVAPEAVGEKLRKLSDDCIIITEPVEFGAVGNFYKNFNEVSDREVANILQP